MIKNRIIYKTDDNKVAVIIPTQEALGIVMSKRIMNKTTFLSDEEIMFIVDTVHSQNTDASKTSNLVYGLVSEMSTATANNELTEAIKAIAIKDVPYGKPFKLCNDTDIPSERTFRDAWVVDDSELTDGIGGESNAFN